MRTIPASLYRWMIGLVLLLSCAACQPQTSAPDLGITVPEGFQIELYATDLRGPTQMILGPDDRIWLAQLAGGESEGVGQVIALEQDNPARRQILLENLYKPTGIAVVDDSLWVAAGRDLLRAELDSQGVPELPVPILEELPFNGRSNGTLTATTDGHLIFETSGRRRGESAAEGSASLWMLDPGEPREPRLIATGLKNAYAHTFDREGRLWVTDVADDPVNGGPPPDELNLIQAGSDYGWPQCYGDQQPALNYGGTEAICAETEPAAAIFPARSTPTSVVQSPWDDGVLLVSLWGPTGPAVVEVHCRQLSGEVPLQDLPPFLTGLAHPQSLLVLPDRSLLVSDFETGHIYRILRR